MSIRNKGVVGFASFVYKKVLEETGSVQLANKISTKAMWFGFGLQVGVALLALGLLGLILYIIS